MIQSFSMQTIKREPGLDLLRALAVTMVLVFHFSNEASGQMFAGLGQYGWMGVDLFFVLSGFLIASQMYRPLANGETLNLRRFYIRRFLRTLPIFFVVLLIYMSFASLRERPNLPPLWKFLTFTQNIGLNRHEAGAFSHAWSLCVEEQFYILLPLLSLWGMSWANGRRVCALFITLFVGGILLRAGFWQWLVIPERSLAHGTFGSLYDEFLYYPTPVRLDGLLVGVGLALIKAFRPRFWQQLISNGYWAFSVGCVLLVAGSVMDKFSLVGAAFTYTSIAFGFGAFLIASLSPQLPISKCLIPGVGTLALLSYAIYLIQKLVFHFAKDLLPQYGLGPHGYIGFFLTAVLCVGFAFVLHFLIERPFLKLRERLI
jgi:peptidoglycan/LPS O-acetylase OafA/YrhL